MKPDNQPTVLGSRSYFKMRQWVKTVASAGTPERVTRFVQTTASWSAGLLTIVAPAAAYLVPGDTVVLDGTGAMSAFSTALIGIPLEVVGVVNTGVTFFSVRIPDQATNSSVALWGWYLRAEFREALFFGKFANQGSPNTTDSYLGPLSANGTQPLLLSADGQYSIVPTTNEKQFLSDWYLDVGTDTEGAVVLYH